MPRYIFNSKKFYEDKHFYIFFLYTFYDQNIPFIDDNLTSRPFKMIDYLLTEIFG